MPVADPVNVIEQLDAPVDPAVREHDWADSEPDEPASVKLTDPEGDVAPAPDESVTVAVHCAAWPTTTGLTQDTIVVVVLWVAVTEVEPVLEECVVSGA